MSRIPKRLSPLSWLAPMALKEGRVRSCGSGLCSCSLRSRLKSCGSRRRFLGARGGSSDSRERSRTGVRSAEGEPWRRANGPRGDGMGSGGSCEDDELAESSWAGLGLPWLRLDLDGEMRRYSLPASGSCRTDTGDLCVASKSAGGGEALGVEGRAGVDADKDEAVEGTAASTGGVDARVGCGVCRDGGSSLVGAGVGAVVVFAAAAAALVFGLPALALPAAGGATDVGRFVAWKWPKRDAGPCDRRVGGMARGGRCCVMGGVGRGERDEVKLWRGEDDCTRWLVL